MCLVPQYVRPPEYLFKVWQAELRKKPFEETVEEIDTWRYCSDVWTFANAVGVASAIFRPMLTGGCSFMNFTMKETP